MAHYRASDSKREHFRRYLEKTGVVDSLTSGDLSTDAVQEVVKLGAGETKVALGPHPYVAPGANVFVSLYEQQEKPANALEFVKQHLGAVGLPSADIEVLQQEVTDLRQRCAHLEEENKDLKAKLQQYESASEDGGTAN